MARSVPSFKYHENTQAQGRQQPTPPHPNPDTQLKPINAAEDWVICNSLFHSSRWKCIRITESTNNHDAFCTLEMTIHPGTCNVYAKIVLISMTDN
jgi:hypothetical protein